MNFSGTPVLASTAIRTEPIVEPDCFGLIRSWYASRPATWDVPSTDTAVVGSTFFRNWSASAFGVVGRPASGAFLPCCSALPCSSALLCSLAASAADFWEWNAWFEPLSYAQTSLPLWIRLYSAASSRIDTFWRSGPSAAMRRVCVPEASSVSFASGEADSSEPPPLGANEPRLPSPGRPRSVVIFIVPESCWVSEAAIFSMSCCALIFGRLGSPAAASAGTSPMVAAATPATPTGTR